MGEIANAILDGTLCEWCGVYIGEPVGYPRRCFGCDPDQMPNNEPPDMPEDREEG